MRTVRVVTPLLLLGWSGSSLAEEPVQPGAVQANQSEQAPSAEANRQQELQARLEALEAQVQQLSAQEAKRDVPASTGAEPVDPELIQAAKSDAARREKAEVTRPIDTVQPIVPAGKMNPDISFILDVGGAWFGKANHLQQGGHAMGDNGLMLQGLELAASASVDPYFRFDTYFQLTEAEVEEAFVTTLALPWSLQARAGLMNAAFGRQNALHLHSWNFTNPPLSHTRFMSAEHFRGPAVELSALMPLPWYLNLMGQVFGTTEELGFNSASFGASENNGTGRIDGPEDLAYVLRMEHFFELSTDWSLMLGLNEGLGQSPFRADGRSYLHGADVYLKWRPISKGQGEFAMALTAEAILRNTAIEEGRLHDGGGYVELDTLLTKRWMTGLRFDTTSLWQGPSPDLSLVPGWQRRGSASLTYLPTHFSKLRIQGDLGKERDRSGRQYALFLQLEVSAGEHGAHKF